MRSSIIRAVLFDFDGTLTRPGALDFDTLRRELGVPRHEAILEYLDRLPPGEEREAKHAFLKRHERAAAEQSVPNTGAEEVLARLEKMGLSVAVFTRNSAGAVDAALKRFSQKRARSDFAVFVTREEGPVKPEPDSVPHVARLLGVDPTEIMVVGDHLFDVKAGRPAGSWTCLVSPARAGNGTASQAGASEGTSDRPAPDYVVAELGELLGIIEEHRPLRVGKLPPEYLAPLLGEMQESGSARRVMVGPRMGEDTAVVSTGGDELVVLESDPITFTTDEIGWYAVHINANDLVCTGAVPAWFLATVLLPAESTGHDASKVLRRIRSACDELGISVVGGHTEVTEAVSQVVVSGTMAGSIDRRRLLDKRSMQAGDTVVLTKSAGLEGTAILCADCPEQLQAEGITEAELREGAGFIERLSVLPDAGVAREVAGVRGMHDVTEGGVMTALHELAQAGEVALTVELDAVPVAPVTERVCGALGLDPLGLIGSGALLIAVSTEGCETLITALHDAGVPAQRVAEVTGGAAGELRATRGGSAVDAPYFPVDEIARFFSS